MEYGWILLRMIGVLAAVCALAYVLLRWGVQRLSPFDPDRTGRLAIVERLGVAPKQSLLVVRAADQVWLIGSSESGIEMLGELDAAPWNDEPDDDGAEGTLEAT